MLGMPWLQQMNPVINWRDGIVSFASTTIDDLYCVQRHKIDGETARVELCSLKGVIKSAK